MMTLTLGVTANQQWEVARQQLMYSVVFLLLLFFLDKNTSHSTTPSTGRFQVEFNSRVRSPMMRPRQLHHLTERAS